MRRTLWLLSFLFALAMAAQGQTGASAASPTLKVSDGTKSFNGVNELRFPVGCVTFSGRTAIVSCSGGTSSGSMTSSQNGNLFYASPNGSYGLPSWRAIVSADIPALDAAKITTGTLSTARLGSGTASSSTYLRGDGTWAAVSGGTVSSVALSMPSIFSISGSPVTTTGTLAATLATQNANKVFAGPASGADAAPTFRALVEADIPALNATKIANGSVSDTEFQYLDGVTSAIQTQIDAKASASSLSTHIADTANPHAVTKAQVGLGSVTNDAQLKIASNLSDLANADTARTNLGLGTSDRPTFNALTVGTEWGGYVTAGNHRMQLNASGTQTPLFLSGGDGSVQVWKTLPVGVGDYGVAFGMAVPTASATQDFIFSTYATGAGWLEKMKLSNAGALTVQGSIEGTSVSLGGGITWTKGAGAPAGACTTGSLYTNTTSGVLSVCESAVWVTK